LVIEFHGYLQHSTASENISPWIFTVYNLQWHALSFLSPLNLQQSSGKGFQRQTLAFFWIPELSLYISLSNSQLTPSAPLKKAVSSQRNSFQVQVEVVLRPMFSRSVCLRSSSHPGPTKQFCYCRTVACLLNWSTLFDEIEGLIYNCFWTSPMQ
jgi:hypothetical protein